jgi:hypothetical protein
MLPWKPSKKTLDLNPSNAIIKELRQKVADRSIHNLTYLLLETALLTSAFALDEPTSFTKCIHCMISLGLNLWGCGPLLCMAGYLTLCSKCGKSLQLFTVCITSY